MTDRILTGARVFDGHTFVDGPLHIAGGRVVTHSAGATQALPGGILAPGFVDAQVNGGGGVMLNAAPSVDTLRRLSTAHTGLGATTILPTLITDRAEVVEAAIAAVEQALAQSVPGIAGLHLEGPHLAVAKKGAHDGALIRAMQDVDLAILLAAAARLPCLKVTVAPEAVTRAQIEALAHAGVVVSLGHSNCPFDAAVAATGAGARCVTHLFNAMSGLDSRAPGLVGAALTQGGLSAGLIADMVHVHPASVQAALRAKVGPGQIFLVSDAMAVAGSDMTEFSLGGRDVRRAEGRLTLEDGTLSGADLDLATAIGNLVRHCDVPLDRALAMATSVPAEVCGLSVGRLQPGDMADFVWLDDDLALRGVWRNGVDQLH